MSKRNADLHTAKKEKNDEFYTRLEEIEKEVGNYKKHFKGKNVLCNCNDPYESNFFKYFVLMFDELELNSLTCISYADSPLAGLLWWPENVEPGKAYRMTINYMPDPGDKGFSFPEVQGVLQLPENEVVQLNGNGDFESEECINFLQKADIVVGNCPFSRFRDYIKQLVDYDKKFLIIGNQNAIKYKEIFPLIKDNKIWLGWSIHSGDRVFYVPDDYPKRTKNCGITEDGRTWIRVPSVRWFTNLDYPQRHDELITINQYDPEEYPQYDTYPAIEVGKTKDIPRNYGGLMGVPITFLDKYNPDQFEIIGELNNGSDSLLDFAKPKINGKQRYSRIVIRNKHPMNTKNWLTGEETPPIMEPQPAKTESATD